MTASTPWKQNLAKTSAKMVMHGEDICSQIVKSKSVKYDKNCNIRHVGIVAIGKG